MTSVPIVFLKWALTVVFFVNISCIAILSRPIGFVSNRIIARRNVEKCLDLLKFLGT